MNIKRVTFIHEDGARRTVYLANPNEVNIIGVHYLHGKQVTRGGYLVTAPYGYNHRHPQGDGMVWRLIPADKIVLVTNREEDRDSPAAAAPEPARQQPRRRAAEFHTAGIQRLSRTSAVR